MRFNQIHNRRKNFLISQTFVLIWGLLLEYSAESDPSSLFLLLYSIWNTISYTWLFISEMKYARDFHPFQILSLSSIFFTGINGLYLYSEILLGEKVDFVGNPVEDILHLGLISVSLEHLILFYVFYFYEARYDKIRGTKKIAEQIKVSKINYGKWAKDFYIIIWAFRLIKFFIPIESFIGSTLWGFINNGYLIVLFLLLFASVNDSKKRHRYFIFHWIIVFLEVILVINHGMKEEIIKPIIPYCVMMVILYKANLVSLNKEMIIKISLLALLITGFVFPYVSIFREISIQKTKEWNEISTTETLKSYTDYVSGEGYYKNDESDRGSLYFMSRVGSIAPNAWIIDYTNKTGNVPEFFTYCSMAAVPRIIWPDKPDMVTGGILYSLASGDPRWMSAKESNYYRTSISIGFAGSCYFCFGLYGAIFLFFLHGIFLVFLWHNLRNKLHYNIIAIYVFINYIMLILKDFEAYQDCGISFVSVNAVLLVITKLFDSKFKHYLKV